MGEAVRVRRSPRFPVYNQSSSNNVQPNEKPPTVKPPTKKQEKPLRRSGRLQKLKPLVGPNGETLMLDLVSSSDDEVEEIVEVEHVVDVVEVAEPEVPYTVNDVVDDWEHVLGSLDPETFDELTLGETFTDGDGDALDDKDRSDDEGDKMYEYGYSFGPVFGTDTNNDEWSAEDEDEEDYNYNLSDSNYSVCGADDEALDDMEPIEEEVQNLEEEIQGSDSSVMRVSTNIFEAEEMAKLVGPKVENVFVCDLKPKMSWPTVEACRDFFINLAIRKKFSYRHLKNDKERLILECKDFNCQWKVSASVTKRDNHTFILRKFLDQHTCEADDENKYAQATSPWVAKTLVDKMRDHPDYKPRDIQKEIFCEFGVSISCWTAWSSRVLMLEKINGNYEVGYQVAAEMCRQIEKSNPGLDAMNGLFPIGFYVCKGENKDTWRLFLSELKPHLIKHKEKLTFISDRQKGLVPAVAEYFPDSNHRFCFRHMYKNFKGKFPGELWESLAWEAAMTYKLPELTRILGTINKTDSVALDWRMLSMKSFEHGVVPNVLYMIKKREERSALCACSCSTQVKEGTWSRYCSPYFSAEAFKATYASYLYPLDNIEDWPEITLDKELALPPEVSTQPGRPRKQRIRADDEMPKSKKKRAKCQEEGHNSRSCDARKKGEFGKKKKRKGAQTEQEVSQQQPPPQVQQQQEAPAQGRGRRGRGGKGRGAPVQEATQVQEPQAEQPPGRGGRGRGDPVQEVAPVQEPQAPGRGGRGRPRGGRTGRGGNGRGRGREFSGSYGLLFGDDNVETPSTPPVNANQRARKPLTQ
ncbi:hypothetical protein IFM89_029709 [Coptis chinensis]|uniref:Transposase MuDR plant domain-containing protein n=1 Tax=Coptis chinensis TaxID=261450 RepID=A0A835LEZ0_9MAGN|nr:hypothetical protein IFM89_029709 [Coptis chinensis]